MPGAPRSSRRSFVSLRSPRVPASPIPTPIRACVLGGQAYENVRYEGYGPGGVALIVDTLTDNRNRTASAVRSALSKFGGSLGETNSVSFMFERLGVIRYPASTASADQMLEAA